MKIIITIDVEGVDRVDMEMVKSVLLDALAEFKFTRLDAQAYVDKRYPAGKDYAWMDRDKKVAEVRGRVATAEMLRSGMPASVSVVFKS